MSKALIALACLAAATMAPRAGLAADHEIDAGNVYFNPTPVHATAGQTVRWTVSAGMHDVTTYGGPSSFASGSMGAGSSYTQTFNGGTVLYRCTPHSVITQGGTCSGMCGAITDRTTAPATPAVTTPIDGSDGHANPVTVSGTGEQWTMVTLTEGVTELARALVLGDGTWSVSINGFSTGSHTLVAQGLDEDGAVSAGTDTVTFVVGIGPDTVKPTASIGTANNSFFLGAVTVAGTASDNRGVAVIRVTFVPVLPLGNVGTYTATCIDCPAGTGGLVRWTLSTLLFPGIYTVTAVATDTSGNVSDPSNSITILSLRVA